jgi:PEGA domain
MKINSFSSSRFRAASVLLATLLLAASPAPAQPPAQQDAGTGELKIVTSNETEKDSGVWVDGEYIGYLRDFWGNKKILLPPGEHEVTIRKFGYKDFTQKIQIESAKTQYLPIMLELDLTTQYPTKNTAELKINAYPPEAAVLIDGAYVGYASQVSGIFKSLTVTAGHRRVRIEMQGYQPYETEIDLAAGQTSEVRAALTKGGPELEGEVRIAQADIRDGATSLQLQPGHLYLYGMAISGYGSSTLFSLGQYASVFHEGGRLAAAVAYGSNDENTYTTRTDRHLLGGVSIAGAWRSFRAFYGSNSASGASDASANVTVDQDSFVVVLGLASSQQQIDLEGLPGLELDTFHSGPTAGPAWSLRTPMCHRAATPLPNTRPLSPRASMIPIPWPTLSPYLSSAVRLGPPRPRHDNSLQSE